MRRTMGPRISSSLQRSWPGSITLRPSSNWAPARLPRSVPEDRRAPGNDLAGAHLPADHHLHLTAHYRERRILTGAAIQLNRRSFDIHLPRGLEGRCATTAEREIGSGSE